VLPSVEAGAAVSRRPAVHAGRVGPRGRPAQELQGCRP